MSFLLYPNTFRRGRFQHLFFWRVEAREEAERLAERERTLEKAKELVEEVCVMFTDISTKSDMDLSEGIRDYKFTPDIGARRRAIKMFRCYIL